MTEYTKEEVWLLKEKYDNVLNSAFEADRERLRSGEPLAYVIGCIPFLNTTIYLDSRPLIPRSETEYWVKNVIELYQSHKEPLRILDLCAGSGCIGVALLAGIKESTVDFVEIDSAHHSTIARNLMENGLHSGRAHIYGGDLFEKVEENIYDLILSNPPYIDPRAMERIEPSVLAYEPHEALFGGEDGLVLVRRIIEEASRHLAAGGSLYIEHEPEQVDAIVDLARSVFNTAESSKDQYGLIRVTHLTK